MTPLERANQTNDQFIAIRYAIDTFLTSAYAQPVEVAEEGADPEIKKLLETEMAYFQKEVQDLAVKMVRAEVALDTDRRLVLMFARLELLKTQMDDAIITLHNKLVSAGLVEG